MTEEKHLLSTAPQGIQSLELAFSILGCIKDADGTMSVTELSKRMGMSKSKLHKYLVSFVKVGGLIQNKTDHTYSLGPRLIDLGLFTLSRFDLVKIASPYLLELRRQLDVTVALVIWTDSGPILAALERSTKPVHVDLQFGVRVPMLLSATGKCYAAFLETDYVKAVIEQEMKQYRLDPSAVAKELEQIRVERLSVRSIPTEGIPGSMAVAAPIFNYTGQLVATVCAVCFVGELNFTDKDSPEIKAISTTAERITAQLS
ncbi:IclR family transcriptional regulator [Brevibacillus sp. NRS-1366]|uniref:IclR family transcriptional regulator n=1 Tax=Brevibacillus sp. NRS-1366 TaxID=3233899 RepID=UPI003D1FB9AF